ncbi:helix-hairpin-helix domain-containing protein [Anaerococcus sp. Marseille-P3625]|uniref:helix-hairpin-helix domain-containing protein n=1 Tax=Anaerococcus sp. Marseille-P3625 TaxID=1977277 RepID=UPI000C07F07B|nr:helix-hairpin-helix domain-containing protein [Anaerococcus sp. Marseille-P3625]
MEDKIKDKLIIGLIIALVALIANNFIDHKEDGFSDSKISLFSSDDEFEETEETKEDSNQTQANETIKVHIAGEINKEGVYEVNNGDRLDDLVKRAGGLTKDANSKKINLAMKLEDQMKIYIPSIYDFEDEPSTTNENLLILDKPSTEIEKININKASKEELMTLPNIGEKRAEAIIEYRENTPFKKIEDIKNVTGIGEKFYQSLRDLITV